MLLAFCMKFDYEAIANGLLPNPSQVIFLVKEHPLRFNRY